MLTKRENNIYETLLEKGIVHVTIETWNVIVWDRLDLGGILYLVSILYRNYNYMESIFFFKTFMKRGKLDYSHTSLNGHIWKLSQW